MLRAGSILFVCALGTTTASAATFTVSNSDSSGPGSLRHAIEQANVAPGPHRIVFDIPGGGIATIPIRYALPALIQQIAIDGTTQPGYSSSAAVAGTPLVQLDGSGALDASGIRIEGGGDGSSVRGLAIGNFAAAGVFVSASNCTLAANHIGCDASGTSARPNAPGIEVTGGSGILIGGADAGSRNVVSGNAWHGIEITHHTDARIHGNYIGTDATGTFALGNGYGVTLGGQFGNSAARAQIGGPNAGEGNIISGNAGNGVHIFDQGAVEGTGYVVQGNRIGTDRDGVHQVANGWNGLWMRTNYSTVGSPEAPNVISGNTESGIDIFGIANVVQDNTIGSTIDETRPLGNDMHGIMLSGRNHRILRNVIAGNGLTGITVYGTSASHSNVLQGNAIGTDRGGTRPLGNGGPGILLQASNNFVGGTSSVEGNRVAFNSHGIATTALTAGNSARGNQLYDNQILDLDLGTDGVTPNDPDDGDAGPNGLQNFPVIDSVGWDGSRLNISGSLDARPPRRLFDIDVYASWRCHPTGHGGARIWIGSVTGESDDSGALTFQLRRTVDQDITGLTLTATASVLAEDGIHWSTSEFSSCREIAAPIESQYALDLPRPHPIRGMLKVPFRLPRPSWVSVRAYDVTGRHVATLWEGGKAAGVHQVEGTGPSWAPGAYVVRLKASALDGSGERFSWSRIMIVTR